MTHSFPTRRSSDLTRVLQRLPADLEGQSLLRVHELGLARGDAEELGIEAGQVGQEAAPGRGGLEDCGVAGIPAQRSEEHTSELQSLMRISYAVFCLKKKKQ